MEIGAAVYIMHMRKNKFNVANVDGINQIKLLKDDERTYAYSNGSFLLIKSHYLLVVPCFVHRLHYLFCVVVAQVFLYPTCTRN